MASYVVKVQFEDSLRRLTLGGDLALSFLQLESRTRDLFNLPTSSKLALTYVDSDGDVVTMAEDQDLRDALVLQALNPLRLRVAILPGAKGNATSDIKMADALPAGDVNGRSNSTSVETLQAEKTADVKGDSAPAEILSENKTATSLNENAAPASEIGKEEQKAAAGEDTDATVAGEAGKEEQVIHYGITCDDCGVSPIAGPRFKSTKKYDYDLCRACFDKPGVDPNDYFMVERRFHRPALRHPFRGGHMMRLNPAFDSRNPNSRNARGTAECARAWGSRCPAAEAVRAGAPENDQAPASAANKEKQIADGAASHVVHRGVKCDGCGMNPITGLRFISNTKFNYDLCTGCFEKSEDGVKEEYTRVDRLPKGSSPVLMKGWYSAASPYRPPICGQGIWVLNRMAQEKDQKKEAEKEVADQQSTDEKSAEAEAVPKETTQPSTEENSTAAAAPPEKQAEVPMVTDEVPVTETDSKQQAEPEGEPEAEKQTSMPQADATVEDTTVPVSVNSVQNDAAAPAAPEGDLSTFDGLLTKLATMGFTDKLLNEELLKKNNMDLRTTLDDLCAAEEWDPILEELQEMGFYDTDMNRRLMFANNGSVKRVVKELVQKAKEPATAAAKGEKQA